jgi:hypothetical protein
MKDVVMTGVAPSHLSSAKVTIKTKNVDDEVLEEEWWKRHTTAEALHNSADYDELKTADELENRVLNMELIYLKPNKPVDLKSA